MKPNDNHEPRSRFTRGPPPPPKGAARLTESAASVVGPEMANTYTQKTTYRQAESDSTSLDIGGRKSREAAQPRGAKSVTAWPFPLPRGAARLAMVGGQRWRDQRGGA